MLLRRKDIGWRTGAGWRASYEERPSPSVHRLNYSRLGLFGPDMMCREAGEGQNLGVGRKRGRGGVV